MLKNLGLYVLSFGLAVELCALGVQWQVFKHLRRNQPDCKFRRVEWKCLTSVEIIVTIITVLMLISTLFPSALPVRIGF